MGGGATLRAALPAATDLSDLRLLLLLLRLSLLLLRLSLSLLRLSLLLLLRLRLSLLLILLRLSRVLLWGEVVSVGFNALVALNIFPANNELISS